MTVSPERIEEALAALERAESFAAKTESYLGAVKGEIEFAHAPAIATARADLAAALREAQAEIARLREVLSDLRIYFVEYDIERTDGRGPSPAIAKIDAALAVSPSADEAKSDPVEQRDWDWRL